MDRLGADFERAVQSMVDRLSAKPLPLNLPVGVEDTFRGVVDLLAMKARFMNEDDLGLTFEVADVPPELVEADASWLGPS
jgi:elongation factor G